MTRGSRSFAREDCKWWKSSPAIAITIQSRGAFIELLGFFESRRNVDTIYLMRLRRFSACAELHEKTENEQKQFESDFIVAE